MDISSIIGNAEFQNCSVLLRFSFFQLGNSGFLGEELYSAF
jgi:hypothetical protein